MESGSIVKCLPLSAPAGGETQRKGVFAIQLTNSEQLREVRVDRQFTTSAIYYEYHVGTRRNMPVTVRFFWVSLL